MVRPRGLPQQGIQGALQGEDEIGPKTLTHSASPNRCHSLSQPLLLAFYLNYISQVAIRDLYALIPNNFYVKFLECV